MGSTGKYTTLSGHELKNHYKPEDIAPHDYKEKLGDPGQFPFTRGIRENMYRDNLWVMGQYSGFASAEEANERYRYLIEQGQTGFSIALDLPTQMGIDSDSPLAAGEVGKVGVAIDSLADIESLFKGIQLEKVRQIRTTANANSIIMLGFYVAFARKHGMDPNKIGFFLQNDCLKEYICRGTYIFPPAASVKLSADVIEYSAKYLPNWTPIAVSGYHIREAGASAGQEIAFSIANMIAYLDEAKSRGVSAEACARNIYFFLGAQVDFLEEVAKFRAARRVFATILRDRYGATDPESQRLKIFVYTCGSALTAEQPLNNIVRVTIEALAAVVGGCQTMASSSYDEAFSLPTAEAVTVALRTQQIIGYESGVTQTADIMGGSYACEALTDKLEEEIWGMLGEIESLGGAVKCIEDGYFQKKLADNAYAFQKSVDDGERVIVGVNKFRDDKVPEIPTFKLSDETERKQTEKLAALRESRDNIRVSHALEAIKKAAQTNENIGEAVIEACDAYATMGEICDVLQDVYGKYVPMKIY